MDLPTVNEKIYPYLLILSALSLSVGGYSLYAGKLVPVFLTYLTIFALAVILILAFLMMKKMNYKLKVAGLILGILGIALSLNPSHISALLNIGKSPFLTIADITMITGFFLFPGIYIVLFFYEAVNGGDKY